LLPPLCKLSTALSPGTGWPLIFRVAKDGEEWTNAGDLMVLTKEQNVGIGTTPAVKLDVSGSGNFAGGLTVTGSLKLNGSFEPLYTFVELEVTGDYTIADNGLSTIYRFQNADPDNGRRVRLPDADSCPNRTYWISRGLDNGNNITVECEASDIEYRDGSFSQSITLTQSTRYQWISDGTRWIVVMYNVG